MFRLFAASIFLGAGLTLALPATAQRTNPPKTNRGIIPSKQAVEGGTTPIKVLLLPSWGVTTGWEDLKTEWPKYGEAPIVIDDSTYIGSSFTYIDLVNSKADVIVISDPSGAPSGVSQYSADEISAVQRYATDGHTVLGTYLVFQYLNADNRGLMPVFGLNPGLIYSASNEISNTFVQVGSPGCLLGNVPSPWHSTGYPYSQSPETSAQTWTYSALDLATVVAQSDDLTGIVSIYNGGTYEAIFISNFPEYYGDTQDLQLLYNAVTCYSRR
jgi:hypothetical protein